MALQSVINAMNASSNAKSREFSSGIQKEYVGRKPKKKRKKALYLAKVLNK
jgi:hypothetical protein